MIGYAMSARTGWGAIDGKPEWGHFKFGHTHPNQSNSGIMALILLACEYYQKPSGLTVNDVMSKEFQDFMIDFERGVIGLSNSTGNMMKEMVLKGPSGYDALLVYESVAIDYLKRPRALGPAPGDLSEIQYLERQPLLYSQYALDHAGPPEGGRRVPQVPDERAVQAKALDHGFRPGTRRSRSKGRRARSRCTERLSIELPEISGQSRLRKRSRISRKAKRPPRSTSACCARAQAPTRISVDLGADDDASPR